MNSNNMDIEDFWKQQDPDNHADYLDLGLDDIDDWFFSKKNMMLFAERYHEYKKNKDDR